MTVRDTTRKARATGLFGVSDSLARVTILRCVRFAAKTNALYDTATAKKLLMRVQVDPQTHEAAAEPELIVAGRMLGQERPFGAEEGSLAQCKAIAVVRHWVHCCW
jgi:hypothetical protein